VPALSGRRESGPVNVQRARIPLGRHGAAAALSLSESVNEDTV
jgi:hypothetical protein